MFGLSDDRKLGLAAIGTGLSQLSMGQAPNLMASPAAQMLQQRQQMAALEGSGLLERFSPEQRAILAQMPPAAAQKVIAGEVFRAPAPQPNIVSVVTGQEAAAMGLDPSKSYEVERLPSGQLVNVSGIGGGDTNVTIGGPSAEPIGTKGDILVEDPTAPGGYRVIQAEGSQAEFERRKQIVEGAAAAIEAAENEDEKQELASRAGLVVLEDIGRVKEKIENAPFWTTGAVGSILSNVGGTQAADVKALTMTIRGNIGFDRLQQMRDASPTGGALGAISQIELETLQSVLGSLEQSQTDEQLLYNLERLETIYTDIMKKAGEYPNAAEFGFGRVGEPLSDEDLFRQYGLD